MGKVFRIDDKIESQNLSHISCNTYPEASYIHGKKNCENVTQHTHNNRKRNSQEICKIS